MEKWVTSWGIAHARIDGMTGNSPQYKNKTMRLSIENNIEGKSVRISFSNRDGRKEMTIISANLQINQDDSKTVLFHGSKKAVIPVGKCQYSDPLETKIKAGDIITISVAFSGDVTSGNAVSEIIHCSSKGNYTESSQFNTEHRSKTASFHDMYSAIPAICNVDVLSENEDAGAIICFGDSITQQSHWTRPLFAMVSNGYKGILSVINKGIGGNRLLRDPMPIFPGYGRAGIKRFDEDVVSVSGAKLVIISIGTNDLGMARKSGGKDWVKAEDLQSELLILVQKAKEQGLKVLVATILPREGTAGYLKEQEAERVKFNEWVRNSKEFDGILDYDMVVRDIKEPGHMFMAYDSGDHLHPGSIGGKKLATCAYDKISQLIK